MPTDRVGTVSSGGDMDLATTTDAELLRRTASGDAAALSEVFDRHAPAVTRYAWALAERRMDVEEIVQDTFVTMWSKAPVIELSEGSLLPWLLVVCRNHGLNQGRRRARASADALPPELVAPDDSDRQEARATLRVVHDEIAALGPLDRRVCELCLVEGRSYAEAAEELGLTVGAVTQRVSRNRARLRKAVEPR